MKEFIDKLISRLDRLIVLSLDKWDGGASENAYKICKDIIQEEVTQYNNGWIPCSERLPEVEGWYIITIESNGKYRVENDLYAVETAEYNGHEHGFCKGRHRKIIAWQPLPAPYQPKE